jgi:carboxypeptidase Q
MNRLLEHKVPVSVRINIATEFGDKETQGYDTIAEIPGTDPELKDEVVMVGGHLDSWIAGTGATDNGAGAIAAMEAMRILNKLHVKPRRTIRIALWSGEEQGLFGSTGYVSNHYPSFHYSSAKEDQDVPLFLRPMIAPPILKPEAAKLDAYYNVDNGTGKLLGIYTEGNEDAAAIFSQWMKPIEDLGMSTITERNTGGSDHVPFQQAGFSGFQFVQDPRDYDSRTHHSNLDTYEHLSEPDLKQAAVVEAIFLYNTAMRDEMLPRPSLRDTEDGPPPVFRDRPNCHPCSGPYRTAVSITSSSEKQPTRSPSSHRGWPTSSKAAHRTRIAGTLRQSPDAHACPHRCRPPSNKSR